MTTAGRLRDQVGELLTALRGPTPRLAMARRLGLGRNSLIDLETGRTNATLDRLDRLGDGYGVRFRLTAVDTDTGHPVDLDTEQTAGGPT